MSHIKPNLWNNVINTNLTSNYRLIRSLEQLLRSSAKSKVLFILDKETKNNKPFHIPYLVSKEGLKKLAKIWAKEISHSNIVVYSCYPPKMSTSLRKTLIPGSKDSQFVNPNTIAKKIIDNLFINKEINKGKVNKISFN